MRRGDPSALSVAVTGIGSVGTSFGMARYGYGLLLPDIQRDYALSATALGAIGAASYVSYLLAVAIAGARAARSGARAVVVAGGVAATAGMVVAGLSHDALALAAGLVLAGASAGLVYPPFSDVVARLPAAVRPRTLSAINCGTGYGVALAAPIAIAAGSAWRTAWLAFAACALATTALAARRLPSRPARVARVAPARGPGLLRPRAAHLLAGGLLVGLGSAAFWTFGVDQLQHTGGLSQADSRAFLGVAGVAAIASTATGDLIARIGVRRTSAACAALEALAMVIVAVAPGTLPAALVAAVLFGAAYNALVAVQVLGSASLYPERPSLGLAGVTAANGLGLLCGPLLSGVLADRFGLTAVLLGGAAIVLAAMVLPAGR